MKVLFQLPYPGYLRIYGSAIQELAARGHAVSLAYDAEKRREPTARATEDRPGVSVVKRVPVRSGRTLPVADGLRLLGDYVRYLDPRFADAQGLRRRMDRFLPPALRPLTRAPTLPRPAVAAVLGATRAAERLLPPVPGIEAYLRKQNPDCVIVTPGVGRGARATRQTDTIVAARRLGIPVAVAVTSWDHLTSKGLIKGDPDRVLLWNAAQRREAVELHGVPADRVVITGAQLFDTWFDRRATVGRDAFLAGLGLPPERPCLVYVGSSPNIAPVEHEVAFVRRWVAALRASRSPGLREAGVLVRPHPGNVEGWRDVDLSGLGPVVVAPRTRPHVPMSEDDAALYHHSLHFAAAVVGVNTSAMVEASIVGKPVHTLRAPEFAQTQQGTLHFRLLVDPETPGVRAADTLEAHLVQLEEALANPDVQHRQAERFVAAFVRPCGSDRPATFVFASAVEALAATSPLAGLRPFVHPVAPRKLRAVVAKRRRRVLTHVARSVWSPRDRVEAGVRDIYEEHYDSDSSAYAASRAARRDAFRLDGTTVYADGWFTIRSHSDLLVETLDRLGARSVLEVGSGRGTNLALLAMRRPALELTGIELTDAGVAQSRELVAAVPEPYVRAAGLRTLDPDARAALHRVGFERANALELPFPDASFDVAFTVLVLEQVAGNWSAVVREMRRVSRSWCIFLEPFGDVNGVMGKAYLRSLDYFRAHHADFAALGLEPVAFTTRIPQKLHFRTGLLVTRVVPT